MFRSFPEFSHDSSDNQSSFDRLVRLASENSPIYAESVSPYLDIASITSESYAKTLDDTFIPILSPSKASCTELVFEMSSISRIDSYSPCSFLVTPNILQVKQEGAQIGFTTQAPASVLKPIFSYTYPDLIKSSVFEENDVATSTNSFCEYIASAILSQITENKTSKVILALNNERIGSFSAIPATPSVG